MIGIFHRVGRHLLELGHRHRLAVIHVPVFFRSAEWQVGLFEADTQEKRLVTVL